jgi:HK97 family phage portal protein
VAGLIRRLSIASQVLFGKETRSTSVSSIKDPSNELIRIFGAESVSGVRVTPENALNVTAVLSCVKVLAETIASLPLRVYRKTPAGRVEVSNHPAYSLVKNEPNKVMTSFEFREMLQGHLALRGNAFAYIRRDAAYSPIELIPMKPESVELWRFDDGSIGYRYQGQILGPADVLHLKGLSSDGYRGLSPITMMREAIGLTMAAEGHGGRLFSQGAQPSGVLEHPGQIGPEASKALREGFDARNSGANSGRTIVLEEGMKWHATSMNSDDAQYLETRKFQIAEIARAFRVPPHMVGDLERSTFSNIEHQGIEFVTHTIRPWVVRWEQSLDRVLLTEEEKKAGFYFGFNLNALQRGDQKSRYEAYAIGRNWGWLSADDIRRLEDMNDLPDNQGSVYLTPMNMVAAGEKPEPAPVAGATSGANGSDNANPEPDNTATGSETNGYHVNGSVNGNRLNLKF